VVLGLAGVPALHGYVRIVIDGKSLAWQNPTVEYRIAAEGSSDLPEGAHVAAIEKAFEQWAGVAGSKVDFVRGADVVNPSPGAGTHVVMWDEDGSTGYFPQGAGIVALTPISYDSGGRILDADVIFNGRDYAWSVDGSLGTFDVQDVLTHEIGHFIGLDHSPSIAASMWPYVAQNQWLHRSLSADDQAGAVAVAARAGQAKLTGVVRRSDGSAVVGAVVHALRAADGRVAGNALSSTGGNFQIKGLPAGSYLLYAAPLEGGMDSDNLTGNGTVQTDFAPAFLGGFSSPTSVVLASGQTLDVGEVTVAGDRPLVETTSSPLILRRGQSQYVNVYGSGFSSGQMGLTSKSPYLTFTSVQSGGTWVRGLVTVASGAPFGTYDVFVTGPGGEWEAASGLVEVVAQKPVVQGVDVGEGNAAGGDTVTVSGTGFQAGCWVLFGGIEAASTTFVDSTTVVATTPAAAPGVVDVAVHNPDGQHDELADGFTFTAQPVFGQLFPKAGNVGGGTEVLIAGDAFSTDVQVLMDGLPLAVEYLSSKVLRVTTSPHDAGKVDLVLRNPGMPDTVVEKAFTFVSSPDPKITSFTPSSASQDGGVTVELFGQNLDRVVEVRFGADPVSALGGTAAPSVEVQGSGRLRTLTPKLAKIGTVGVVAVTDTGQGAVASGFVVSGSSSFGGSGASLPGGGGCGGMVTAGPAGADSARGDLLALVLWVAAYLAFWVERRLRRPAPQRIAA